MDYWLRRFAVGTMCAAFLLLVGAVLVDIALNWNDDSPAAWVEAIGTILAFFGLVFVHFREQYERRSAKSREDFRIAWAAGIAMHVAAIRFELTVQDLIVAMTRRGFPNGRPDDEVANAIVDAVGLPEAFKDQAPLAHTFPFWLSFRDVVFYSQAISNLMLDPNGGAEKQERALAGLHRLLEALKNTVDGIEELTGLAARSVTRSGTAS